MKPKHKRRTGFFTHAVVLIVFWIIFVGPAHWPALQAGEPAKTPGEAKPASPLPAAIPDSEIIPRADETVKTLQKLKREIAADFTLASIQKDFAAFVERSDRRREAEAESAGKSRSVQRLNEIQREWSLEQSQLDDWDRALARRSRILAAQDKDLDQIIETWRATQVAVAKKFFFKAVLQRRVEEVLKEAQTVRLAVQEQTARLLKVQSEIADRMASLDETRKEIDQAREELGRSILALDSPPLWEALFQPEAQNVIGAQAAESLRNFVDDLREFIQKYGDRILWHGLFFLGMVALFHFLRRGLTAEAVERLGGFAALFILDRVVATSFLLASIAVPLFYPGATASILRMAVFPATIPIIRLLPGLLPKFFRSWVYALVALYVLDFVRYLLPADALLTRVLLLIIAGGGCVGLGVFLRTRGQELSAFGSRERFLVLAARVVLILFAISVVSNLIGSMTIAEILVAAPVRITYAAALIATGAHLLMTLTVVALQSRPGHWFRSVQRHSELIAFRCRALIRFIGIVFWVIICLNIVGMLGDVSSAGAGFLQLRWNIGAAEISVQNVVVFLSVFFGAILFSRLLRFVLTEEVLPRIHLPRGVPGAVDVLSRYGILLLGFFIALTAAGVDLSKVTLLISALGVGIGFGLQNVVNNFVSGLILAFEHPVQVGDFVEVGTISGEVSRIGFRASILRTPDGAEVIVPNSEIIGSKVINWSLSDRFRRISIPVSVAYGSDPDRVIGLLLETARRHPAVVSNPEPLAVFDRFGDSALNFTLLCWTFVDSFFMVRSELTIAVNKAFKEARIEIPFPQQDVHVHWPDKQGIAAEPSGLSKDFAQDKSTITEASVLLTGKGHVASS